MKKEWIKWIIVASVLVCEVMPLSSKAQGVVSFQVFYDELQHHGTWMQHATHGYVWMPRVGHDFVPYGTNGYWIQTDYGNTWVSDYSWGWAPFHYGRWFYDDFYGWMWVPDTVWGPAWVAWRSGGGYYGWAPLMPGYGIHSSVNYYHHIPHHYWNFVPYRYITYRRVYTHCVPRTRVVNVIHHTTIVNHNYVDNSRNTFFTGPSRSDIERTTRTRVQVYKVNERVRPGSTNLEKGTASFYRPRVENRPDSKMKSSPNRFITPERNESNIESREDAIRQFQENKFSENNSRKQSTTLNDKDVKSGQQDFRTFDRYKSTNRNNDDNSTYNFNRQPDRTSTSRPEYKVERQSGNSMQRNSSSQDRSSFESQNGNGQTKMKSRGFQKQNTNHFNGNSFQKEKTTDSPNSRSSQINVQPKQPIKRSSPPSRK